MPRLTPITACVLCAWLWLAGFRPGPVAAEDFVFHHENVMGTAMELQVVAVGPEAARGAEDRVLREIDRLAAIFSGYDPASELGRWQAASPSRGPQAVSAELFDMLLACDRWRERSGGAFDPRVQALTRLWSASAEKDRAPTSGELSRVGALMSRPAWRLDLEARTAERLSDCPISLNAIAKGAILERACEVALDPGWGVRGLVLNVGGDLRVCGDTTRTVGIAPPWGDSESSEPFTRIEVRDRAVATSGSSHRGFRVGGKRYSHIFDPRSGLPADGIASATVIADRSADADALATILNVLSPAEGLRLADSVPGAECLIVTADGRIERSEGWHRYERPISAPLALADVPAPAAPTAPSWGDEYELVVNFEINHPEADGGRYRRPFVAIWVEDKAGVPVRNVALWVSLGGPGPWEWLKDLKRWHLSDQIRKRVDKRDMVLTMSRPTRPPGKYSVSWDGKDDHGKPVGGGEYILFIDAAREHGTYQSIRTPITIGDRPFAEELPGNIEVKSASLEFRRKTPGARP